MILDIIRECQRDGSWMLEIREPIEPRAIFKPDDPGHRVVHRSYYASSHRLNNSRREVRSEVYSGVVELIEPLRTWDDCHHRRAPPTDFLHIPSTGDDGAIHEISNPIANAPRPITYTRT